MATDTKTNGSETDPVQAPESIFAAAPAPAAVPVASTLEAVDPRLANAVDRWWGGNMVPCEEWQQRQSYAQRDDLKNFLTKTLEGA